MTPPTTIQWRGRSIQGRGRLCALLVLLACWMSASGCYTYHVYQTGGAEGRELGNQPSTEWEGKTLNSFFWGAVRQDLPVENCRLGDGTHLGIEEVKIETNFAYILASTLTLGIWVPLDVNWRCAKPRVPTGTL